MFAGDEKTNVRVRFFRSGLHGAATEAKRRELAAPSAIPTLESGRAASDAGFVVAQPMTVEEIVKDKRPTFTVRSGLG